MFVVSTGFLDGQCRALRRGRHRVGRAAGGRQGAGPFKGPGAGWLGERARVAVVAGPGPAAPSEW